MGALANFEYCIGIGFPKSNFGQVSLRNVMWSAVECCLVPWSNG